MTIRYHSTDKYKWKTYHIVRLLWLVCGCSRHGGPSSYLRWPP